MCSSLSVLSLTVHVNSYGKSCSYSHYKFCNEHVAEIWISCVFSLIYSSTIAFAFIGTGENLKANCVCSCI